MEAYLTDPRAMIARTAEANQKHALRFVELGESLGDTFKIRQAANGILKCTYAKNKPSRAQFTLECGPMAFRIKANLPDIGRFADQAEAGPDAVRAQIRKNLGCGHHTPHCRSMIQFRFDGEDCEACNADAFFFSGLDEHGWAAVEKLIKLQHEY